MKLIKFFSKGFDEVKDSFIRFKGAYILSFIVTLALVIVYENVWFENRLGEYLWEKIALFYACCGVCVWACEVVFDKWWQHIIGYFAGVGIGVFWVYNTYEHKYDSRFEYAMLGYVIIAFCIGFFTLIKKAKIDAHRYYLNTYQNLFSFHIAYFTIAIGVYLIVLVVSVLLLEESDNLCLLEKVWMLLTGWLYIPGIIYSVTKKKSHITKFIQKLIKYVLYPLTMIALVTMYIYIVKILIYFEMPSNEVYNIVMWLFILGYSSVLLVRNYMEDSKFYKKTWLYVVIAYIPLIILQIISLSMRCNEYGITNSRYLGICFIVVEIATVLLTLIRVKKKDVLEYVFMVLLVIVIIATMTPLNVWNSTYKSQISILTKTWKKGQEFEELSKNKQVKVLDIYDYMRSSDKKIMKEYLPKYMSADKLEKLLVSGKTYDVEEGYVDISFASVLVDEKVDVEDYSTIIIKKKEAYSNFVDDEDKNKKINKEIEKKINELYDKYGNNLEKELEKDNKIKLSKDRDMLVLELVCEYKEGDKIKLEECSVDLLILEK